MAKTKGARNPELVRVRTEAMQSRPGLTQIKLANQAGVSQSTVSRMKRGEVDSQQDKVRRVLEALGISAHPFIESSAPESGIAGGENRERAGGLRRVPIISLVQAGNLGEAVDPYPAGQGSAFKICPEPCGPRTFALKVMGESMEPRYHHGDIIFVDPDKSAVHGSAVIVRLEDSKEATFKQLVMEGSRRYLKPLNPRFPIIEITTEAQIVGPVIACLFSP